MLNLAVAASVFLFSNDLDVIDEFFRKRDGKVSFVR